MCCVLPPPSSPLSTCQQEQLTSNRSQREETTTWCNLDVTQQPWLTHTQTGPMMKNTQVVSQWFNKEQEMCPSSVWSSSARVQRVGLLGYFHFRLLILLFTPSHLQQLNLHCVCVMEMLYHVIPVLTCNYYCNCHRCLVSISHSTTVFVLICCGIVPTGLVCCVWLICWDPADSSGRVPCNEQ